jgi:hypothetical protein
MFDRSNTPGAVRAEDQRLIEAINDVRRRYPFSDAVAEQLLDDFTKPTGALRQWIFGLCDPAMRASPFVARDDLAAFTREVMTRGQDYNARWTDLTPKERSLARRIERFAQDKRRVWMGAGRPQNVDPLLVLYVIQRIEEATGVAFRFSRPAPLRGAAGTPGPARLGGSMFVTIRPTFLPGSTVVSGRAHPTAAKGKTLDAASLPPHRTQLAPCNATAAGGKPERRQCVCPKLTLT